LCDEALAGEDLLEDEALNRVPDAEACAFTLVVLGLALTAAAIGVVQSRVAEASKMVVLSFVSDNIERTSQERNKIPVEYQDSTGAEAACEAWGRFRNFENRSSRLPPRRRTILKYDVRRA
jgi:hypothetical protein